MAQGINNCDRGMTLIELMVVISIIAILAVIATLSMDFIHKERVTSSIKEVASDLKKLRMDAMTTGPTTAVPNTRGKGIRFTSVSGYVMFTFNDCSGNYLYDADGCPGSSREEAGTQTVALPGSLQLKRLSGVSLVSPANGADDIIIFDRFGQARKSSTWEAAGALVLVVQHISGLHGKCIQIESNRIREGSWNGTSNTCTAN